MSGSLGVSFGLGHQRTPAGGTIAAADFEIAKLPVKQSRYAESCAAATAKFWHTSQISRHEKH